MSSNSFDSPAPSLAERLAQQAASTTDSSAGSSQSATPAPTAGSEAAVTIGSAGSTNGSQSSSPADSTAAKSSDPAAPRAPVSILPASLPSLGNGRSSTPSSSNAAAQSVWSSAGLTSVQAGPGLTASARTSELVAFQDVDSEARKRAVTEIQRLTGASVETSRTSSGTTTFVLKGLVADVEKAKNIIHKNLTPQVTRTFQIPAAARSTVIGAKGQNLRSVIDATQTKINVGQPGAAATDGVGEGQVWDLPTVSVEIVGPEQAVAHAEQLIREQIETRGTQITSTRVPVAKRLVPFVRAHAAKLSAAAAEAAASESAGKSPRIDVRGDGSVTVSGGPSAVAQLTRSLDDFVVASEESFASKSVNVSQAIKVLPTDFLLEEFNVVLDGSDLYGTPENLAAAAKALEKHAKSLSIVSLDISRAHNRNTEHARRVAKYFGKSRILREIESDLGVNISEPTLGGAVDAEGAIVYHITGATTDATASAKKRIVDAVNRLPPAGVLGAPGFESQVGLDHAQRVLKRAQKDSNVFSLLDKDETLLVFVGQDDDFAPSAEEMSETLHAVADQLSDSLTLDASVVSTTVPLSGGEQRHIREPFGSAKGKISELTSDSEGSTVVHISYFDGKITVEGPREQVDALIAEIPALVDSSKDYQRRNNYTESIRFPPKLLPNLIGRQGATISKIKDEHQVKIDVAESGEVTLKGLEANVRKAKATIAELETKLQDEIETKIKVPQQYHSLLIGAKGKSARRMMDKYDVHVQFPKLGTPPSSGGDGEATDDTSVIVLRGPSKGVAQAKKEILDLIEYEKSNSHLEEVNVPSNTLNRVIGRQGNLINAIKDSTETTIDVAKKHNDDGTVTITVRGNKAGVSKAVKQIQAAVESILDRTEKTIDVDRKYHRFILGPSSETKRSIISKAGGDPDAAAAGSGTHILHVPAASSSSTSIRLVGPSKAVASMEEQILAIVAEREKGERSVETVEITYDQSRALIGPGGATKRDIEGKYGVSIDIPRRGSETPADARVEVTIKSAEAENVAKAREHISGLVSQSPSARLKIKVPTELEGHVFSYGLLAKQLEDEHNVRLNVNRRPTPRDGPTPPEAPADALKTEPFAFEARLLAAEDRAASGRDVTWTLAGKTQAAVDAAAAVVRAAVANAEAFDTVGFLWFPKAANYSAVIGPGGKTINGVRKASGASVSVLNLSSKGSDPIVIRGSAAQVEEARRLLVAEAATGRA